MASDLEFDLVRLLVLLYPGGYEGHVSGFCLLWKAFPIAQPAGICARRGIPAMRALKQRSRALGRTLSILAAADLDELLDI